jgi:hypothetical protein
MKDTLQPAIGHRFIFDITDRKTVPALFPESEAFQQMPEPVCKGTHERFVVDKERFSEKLMNKMESNSSR